MAKESCTKARQKARRNRRKNRSMRGPSLGPGGTGRKEGSSKGSLEGNRWGSACICGLRQSRSADSPGGCPSNFSPDGPEGETPSGQPAGCRRYSLTLYSLLFTLRLLGRWHFDRQVVGFALVTHHFESAFGLFISSRDLRLYLGRR